MEPRAVGAVSIGGSSSGRCPKANAKQIGLGFGYLANRPLPKAGSATGLNYEQSAGYPATGTMLEAPEAGQVRLLSDTVTKGATTLSKKQFPLRRERRCHHDQSSPRRGQPLKLDFNTCAHRLAQSNVMLNCGSPSSARALAPSGVQSSYTPAQTYLRQGRYDRFGWQGRNRGSALETRITDLRQRDHG